MKVLFIGGGNMAQAIIGGLLANGANADQFQVVEPLEVTRSGLHQFGVHSTAAFETAQLACDAIILAVKPQVMRDALLPLGGQLSSQLIISIAAGVRCDDIAAWAGGGGPPHANIVRAMPNTPALIHAGITGLYAAPGVTQMGRTAAQTLLASLGKTAWFADEAMLDAVTAVSGSGPAYVFYFIEALESAALDMGFDAQNARTFAIETFLGGAKLAAQSADSPAELRRKVTSKRGTTERALETFAQHGLAADFVAGVKAACQRSRELGAELGRASPSGDAKP